MMQEYNHAQLQKNYKTILFSTVVEFKIDTNASHSESEMIAFVL
ncbi:hypothetical protein [Flavobacterium pisciphilum]|nr:hypothetical protein [Flavobacterium sp. F-65]